MSLHQQVFWVPKTRRFEWPYKDRRPFRVWTLYQDCDPNTVPKLPLRPVHRDGAFLEDYMHDWTIRGGFFRYGSRVVESEVWILCEFKDDPGVDSPAHTKGT